jgi:hypothetical protein
LTEDRAGRSRELISFFSAFADQVVHEFGMRYDGKVMMHGTVQYPFAGLACWRCLAADGHGHGHHDGLRVALNRVSVTKASNGSWSLWFFILTGRHGRISWLD